MARLCGLLILAVWITFSSQAQADEKAGVGIEVHQDYLDFRIGQETVTRYHIAQSVAKPYFWPVLGPYGVAMTRAWPMEKALPAGPTIIPIKNPPGFATAMLSQKASPSRTKYTASRESIFGPRQKAAGELFARKSTRNPTAWTPRMSGEHLTAFRSWRKSGPFSCLISVRRAC